MVSVDQAYMVGHMKNADGSINNKNVVLSAACEAAELFQCMMSVNQKLEDWQRFNHTLEMHLRSVECEKIHDICQAVYGMKHPSNELEGLYLAREDEQIYEDSMKGVADQIIKEQQRASKIKNNPEEFHWHDEYATLNFFRFICKNIGNLRNGEIEKMVTRLKNIDQKAVENHVNGAVWAFDYDKMFCVLMENEICRKVCEKNKYNSWMKLIGQYCISMA